MAATSTTQEVKRVKLQVNSKGSWRDVMEFDAEYDSAVLDHADKLFAFDLNRTRLSLRVIIPGDTAPLMNWTHEGGWKAWRVPA